MNKIIECAKPECNSTFDVDADAYGFGLCETCSHELSEAMDALEVSYGVVVTAERKVAV